MRPGIQMVRDRDPGDHGGAGLWLEGGRFQKTIACLALAFMLPALKLQALPSVTTNDAGSLVLTNHFGDLNNDGEVDVRDVVLLTHHLNGIIPLSPALTNRADLNQDAAVNATDRSVLANMIACRNTKADEDFDADELSNVQELQRGTNPFDPDTDRDGSLDGWEVVEGTNPHDAQSGLRLFVIAMPPVQVIHPLIQNTDTSTFGTVLARPPVTVTNPPPQ
ncbi:MAG TPA: dockerin type I repeat-containing protein [Verrucomicrobiae bacterium]